EGVHSLQVEATDSLGQVVDSVPATLKVDRRAPRVKVKVSGSTLIVLVVDGARKEVSGVRNSSVHVRFGDGSVAHGHATLKHSYARGGLYTIVVSASDNAGNKRTVRKRVRVP
ncbi:MAG TPA: PKD domain-containing protein, partial [Solirubrobacteraceae bacterium]